MTKPFLTLTDFNNHLLQMGLKPIGPSALGKMLRAIEKSELEELLWKAESDPGALELLKWHIAQSEGRAPALPSSTRAAPDQEQQFDPRDRVRVFTQTGALTFEASINRENIPTLLIDGAIADPDKKRSYQWGNKVTVQVMPRDLPLLFALLTRRINQRSFEHYGKQNNKSFEGIWQKDNLYFKLSAPGFGVGVPMELGTIFQVSALTLRVLKQANPGLDADEILTLLSFVIAT